MFTEDRPKGSKGLVDFLSAYTVEETREDIKHNRSIAPDLAGPTIEGVSSGQKNSSTNTIVTNSQTREPQKAKDLSKSMEKELQSVLQGVYEPHTLEIICYCLDGMVSYNTELKEGDTFSHRLVLNGQIDALKHLLKRGVDTELCTAIHYNEFPRTLVNCNCLTLY